MALGASILGTRAAERPLEVEATGLTSIGGIIVLAQRILTLSLSPAIDEKGKPKCAN